MKLLLFFSMLFVFLGFNPNESEVGNTSDVQVLAEDDNNYEFQQYVLACTREWTAAGYSWCTLGGYSGPAQDEFMRIAEECVYIDYNYEDDSYVIWKTQNGVTIYTLMCMCEQYNPGFSFTPSAEYID